MKMNRITLIIIIAFSIGGILFVQFGKKGKHAKRNLLKNEGGFAIGIFESRNLSNGRTYSISFSYTVDSIDYRNGGDTQCFLDSPISSDAFTNRNLAKRNDNFLVLYDKGNPRKSIIRLDYPIRDSTDFKRCVKEFEQIRKQKVKEIEHKSLGEFPGLFNGYLFLSCQILGLRLVLITAKTSTVLFSSLI
jgi:hypothetical protein